MIERVLQVITTVNSRSYERDIKLIWDNFKTHQNREKLLNELDEYFVDTNLYTDTSTTLSTSKIFERTIDIIDKSDIKLICYQWFKP
ncbi:MAG TPA: hypothetical protein V6C58_12755 [Allocoleopsis sp.]